MDGSACQKHASERIEGGAAVRMEMLENGCLKILLTAEDLDSLGISFADLDYGKPATRLSLIHISEPTRP